MSLGSCSAQSHGQTGVFLTRHSFGPILPQRARENLKTATLEGLLFQRRVKLGITILDSMQNRVLGAGDDSAYFIDCLNYGELVLKLTVLGTVATIGPNRERLDYAAKYRLVSAEGIGAWREVLDDALSGPAAQYAIPEASEERRELMQYVAPGNWQYEAVHDLHSVLERLDLSDDRLGGKLALRQWISDFVTLRNKTRGHGAQPAETLAQCIPTLLSSIDAIIHNFALFRREWAYLHRNLTLKYRVMALSSTKGAFDYLKSSRSESLSDGVYVWFGRPVCLDLLEASPNADDFFIPNGNYRGGEFEQISYLTGDSMTYQEHEYDVPPINLPQSETQGAGALDLLGKSFANLPDASPNYVRREALEADLTSKLVDTDRHPIVTLVGVGGIGKTSTALNVLHSVTKSGAFGTIVWLSARDIDLSPDGPRRVRPAVLTRNDVAKKLVEYLEPPERLTKGFSATTYMEQELACSSFDAPMLLVLDNFETVRDTSELFAWVDAHVRTPNKVLITTRIRDFKADYPIEVSGMNWEECRELIRQTAMDLSIEGLIDGNYAHQLWEHTEGHPYVIKMLLGEISRTRKPVSNLEQLLSRRPDVLTALFERTYGHLTPAAKRVFLTLAQWRSLVPEVAIDAVVGRQPSATSAEGRLDAAAALEELKGSSLIESKESDPGKTVFVTVPMTASIYGKKKLETEPMESEILVYVKRLQMFGTVQEGQTRHGLEPLVRTFFSNLSLQLAQHKCRLDDYAECMEILAQAFPKTLLLRTALMDELGLADGSTSTREDLVRQYIQSVNSDDEKLQGWQQLTILYQKNGDVKGEVHAQGKICALTTVSLGIVSEAATKANRLLALNSEVFSAEEAKLIAGDIADNMRPRMAEANATDCSRLAWLLLRSGREDEAREWTLKGCNMDPDNEHCQSLADRLHLLRPPK